MVEGEADRFLRLREEYERARERMAEARFSATSEDGYITAVVDARGQVLDFEFDARVRRLDTHDLKAGLLATIAQAREEALRSSDQELRTVFGPEYRLSVLESGSIAEIQSMTQEIGKRFFQRRPDRYDKGGG